MYGDRNPYRFSSAHCRRRSAEAESRDPVATACSWKSCAAGVIADCVAVCCCPCGVVNILVLAFVKLPWAVARRCVRRRRRRRKVSEGNRERWVGEIDGIWGMATAAAECKPEVGVAGGEGGNDHFTPGEEDVWEFSHLGFGRISFTGVPPHSKGN